MRNQEIGSLADTITKILADKPKESDVIFGTVTAVAAKRITVIIDGASTSSSVVRACNPTVGDRVVITKRGKTWLATAVIGGGVTWDHIIEDSTGWKPSDGWDTWGPSVGWNLDSEWVWEKWKSGRAFARRRFTFSNINVTIAWGTSGFYASAVSFGNFPTGLFYDSPVMLTQTHHTSVAGVNTYNITSTSAGIGEIFSFRSYTGLSVPISVIAEGYWKPGLR